MRNAFIAFALANTLGFGFLVTLDRPPLDLRDSALLVPVAYLVLHELAGRLVPHGAPAPAARSPVDGRCP